MWWRPSYRTGLLVRVAKWLRGRVNLLCVFVAILIVNRVQFTLAPLHLKSLYTQLDERANNVVQSVGRVLLVRLDECVNNASQFMLLPEVSVRAVLCSGSKTNGVPKSGDGGG